MWNSFEHKKINKLFLIESVHKFSGLDGNQMHFGQYDTPSAAPWQLVEWVLHVMLMQRVCASIVTALLSFKSHVPCSW